ncbi:hypothetical protein SETIT_6G175800v2 [Setaria italica]|uniref:Uncharacterized protein n=2 Tax=Setaria TaxID=4554 RepID=A0A368RMN9_SETIT|nr:hypothetical protein SETIT_6G175800v2 [Setaria italica]RCV31422.1 hypothetical protein SETIT_6G175800v2 [Setaria italica]TKW10679.1 hypothetical protein SEVIR_6G182100v2 [Setaria viridis]TKW10680.1 hypothetical protein SEVIR_6G182100v2 [Setaria viridis]TKW10681.1 hypothetical protein SEVIR_6G182100v2 [Setaria viridis]
MFRFFVASQEKFHGSADNQYWKSISKLNPHEVGTIKKGKERQ